MDLLSPIANKADRGFVGALPRPLRRAVRRFEGFLNTARPMRAGIGSVLAVSFFLSGAAYATVASGHWGSATSHAAAGFGLGVGDIRIAGHNETRLQDIYDALDLEAYPSLVGLDLADARERVEALPWIAKATLRARYPRGLAIDVEERRAFAVWQKDDTLTIVEKSGRPITRYGITDLLTDRFGHLPKVVGLGAADHAAELLPLAARHDGLVERVSAYVRVSDRRWDIVFDTGLRLKLPEKGAGRALTRFALLEAEHELLARPLVVADLRTPGRTTLRLTPEVAEERTKAAKEHLAAMRKADKVRRGAL